jgi:hypothetical protein
MRATRKMPTLSFCTTSSAEHNSPELSALHRGNQIRRPGGGGLSSETHLALRAGTSDAHSEKRLWLRSEDIFDAQLNLSRRLIAVGIRREDCAEVLCRAEKISVLRAGGHGKHMVWVVALHLNRGLRPDIFQRFSAI